jgi:hypothetical protein
LWYTKNVFEKIQNKKECNIFRIKKDCGYKTDVMDCSIIFLRMSNLKFT